MKDILFKLLRAQKIANAIGGRSVLHVSAAIREINAAKNDIEIETWSDFESWWNNNRSQSLKYTFIDIYGEDSEEVSAVNELMDMASDYETKLHDLYTKLRNKELGIDESSQVDEPVPDSDPEPPVEQEAPTDDGPTGPDLFSDED